MSAWRLLKLKTCNGYENMAIDEAILTARIKDLVPNTLRLYRWKPSAVSIGRFQNIENEVQLGNCRKQGVDVVRRITGGGTVYHDCEDEITYSVIASKHDLGTSDIAATYAILYDGLAEALRTLGVAADFNEGNAKTCPNLTVNGQKVSGSAQTHKVGVVLQHGTLLLDIDFEKMFSLLRVPWAKSCVEVISVAKDKMTSINRELGREVAVEEATQALVRGFARALNMELVESEMIPYELELAEKLQKEKYARDEWNCGKTSLD
jgi:lipoyltransferase/lipoate-protein ligase